MTICSDDLKAFAILHAKAESDEAHIRASVSRAYYAAFHALIPLAKSLPASANASSSQNYLSHHELVARLNEWKPSNPKLARLRSTARTLAQATKTARASRVRADYSLDTEVRLEDASTQLVRVKKILQIVTQLSAEIEAK